MNSLQRKLSDYSRPDHPPIAAIHTRENLLAVTNSSNRRWYDTVHQDSVQGDNSMAPCSNEMNLGEEGGF